MHPFESKAINGVPDTSIFAFSEIVAPITNKLVPEREKKLLLSLQRYLQFWYPKDEKFGPEIHLKTDHTLVFCQETLLFFRI